MYDVPGRVNNLYKEPVTRWEPEEEIEVSPGYPPQCEFTRATGRGTAEYCEAMGPPPQIASQNDDRTWLWGFICVVVLLAVFHS